MADTVDAEELLSEARSHVGQAYVLGAKVPKDSPDFAGPWDCAELVSYAVAQVLDGRLVGCVDNRAAPARANAFSGAWARDARLGVLARVMSVAEAMVTPGAVLVREPAEGAVGHVVLSAGGGRTIEAMSPKRGVLESSSVGRRWDMGVHVIGIRLGTPIPLPRAHQVGLVLRVGSKGPEVRELQSLLGVTVDGKFGTRQTLPAVLEVQRNRGLVVDGEVQWTPAGETRKALDPGAT